MRKPFHKLYFPGLISLVFLPIMCICYLINRGTFQKYYAMAIVWPNKEELNYWNKVAPPAINIETFRKYTELPLTGNRNHDTAEIELLRTSIKQLIVSADTVNGAVISFGNHAKYAEVVNVLDICLQTHGKDIGFTPYHNKVFIWHFAPPIKSQSITPSGCLCNDEVYIKADEPLISIEKIKNSFIVIYKTMAIFWPSLLIFILMLWFAIFKKKRYWSLKTFHFGNN